MTKKIDPLQLSLFGEVETVSNCNGLKTIDPSVELLANKKVRRNYNAKTGKNYFSMVNVMEVVFDSKRPRKYWEDLKTKLLSENFQLSEKIGQLKMLAEDGKMRMTDVADTETLFRILQSITSPKVEPFKQWLAKVGYERLEETANPELGIRRSRERAKKEYKRRGYSDEWIEKRIEGVEVRVEFTDTLKAHGAKEPKEYAKCTNAIYKGFSGMTAKQYEKYKGLKKGDKLRDNFAKRELFVVKGGEFVAKEIMDKEDTKCFDENLAACEKGGEAANEIKKIIERAIGAAVITRQNFLSYKQQSGKLGK